MAHLIKLEDYLSRYQFDLNRYPSQFTRMKKEKWYYQKKEWEQLQVGSASEKDGNCEQLPRNTKDFISEWQKRFKKWTKRLNVVTEEVAQSEQNERNESFQQMKELFYNDLYSIQLDWASSSLLEESILDPKHRKDKWLKFFTQEIPDNYFLMYKPIFFIKQAHIELDILLISPTEILCISIIDGQKHSVFEASSDRFWTEYINQTRRKRISPLLSLSRMSGVVHPILKEANIDFPVRNVVLCPTGIIDNKMKGAKVELIDQRNFARWHERVKNHPSPVKSQQLRTISLLFKYCKPTASKR